MAKGDDVTFDYQPPGGDLAILHEDAALLVVEKPPGLLSVPGKDPAHKDCVLSRLVELRPEALLVHRLDMDTSGLMVFAKHKKAQRHLGLQFERRHIGKVYQALVAGVLAKDEGQVDLPLIVDWPNRPLQKICHETGRAAQTDWQVLERGADHTRVRLVPKTGRSHQLRVHMLALGHPIVGDRFYGNPGPRLMLHAEALSLYHPDGGARVEFTSDVPF